LNYYQKTETGGSGKDLTVAADERIHSKATRETKGEINKASTKKTLGGQAGLNYYKKAETRGI
jgi:hypothetical protein